MSGTRTHEHVGPRPATTAPVNYANDDELMFDVGETQLSPSDVVYGTLEIPARAEWVISALCSAGVPFNDIARQECGDKVLICVHGHDEAKKDQAKRILEAAGAKDVTTSRERDGGRRAA